MTKNANNSNPPSNQIPNKSNTFNDNDTNQMYADQTFQAPLIHTQQSKYASQVQTNFSLDYEKLTYQQIQLSATSMREMLKKLSHILDFKLHQNYGMMGVTIVKPETDLQKIVKTLKQESQANNKLIQAQISEIKNIQVIDQQMASNKRVQVQAQKLREMRKIKKQMVQSQKQSRFNRGQISKAGDYLARDLDSDKLNFRLNKIKEDIQYMLVKEKNLIEQQVILIEKVQQMHNKNQQMKIVFQQNLKIAQMKNLAVSANKSYMSKKNKCQTLKKEIQHKRKNLEVQTYNTKHNTFMNFKEVQQLKKQSTVTIQKLDSLQGKINQLKKQIHYNIQKNKISDKLDQSMIIKNIQTLLRKKNQKQTSDFIFQSSQTQLKYSANSMSESLILKPNFKIKPFLLNSSRLKQKQRENSKLDMSLDIKQKKSSIFRMKSYSKQKITNKNKSSIHNQEEEQLLQKLVKIKKQISIEPLTLEKKEQHSEKNQRDQQFPKKQQKAQGQIQFQFDD